MTWFISKPTSAEDSDTPQVYVAINRHGRREHREDHVTKTEALPTHRGGTSRRHDPLFPVAAGAAAFGVCCGLPLLGSLGAAGVIAGLEVGSWITVAPASFIAVIGVLRWHRQRVCHPGPGIASAGLVSTVAVGATAPHQQAGQ